MAQGASVPLEEAIMVRSSSGDIDILTLLMTHDFHGDIDILTLLMAHDFHGACIRIDNGAEKSRKIIDQMPSSMSVEMKHLH